MQTSLSSLTQTTVRTAIEDSIRETRIVHLTISGIGSEYESAVSTLEAECDDWTAAAELEYWGTDEDGDEWRVHVERREAEAVEERCEHPRVTDGRCDECGDECSHKDGGAEDDGICHDPACPLHGEQ